MSNGNGNENDNNNGGCREPEPFRSPFPSMGAAVRAAQDPRNMVDTALAAEDSGPSIFDQIEGAMSAVSLFADPEPDFAEIAEGLGFNFAAGKRKWVIDAGLVYGSQDLLSVDFFPPAQDPCRTGAYPANVPGPREAAWEQGIPPEVSADTPVDTFRHVTGKMWLNWGHVGGVVGGNDRFTENSIPVGEESRRPEFSFYNKTNILFKSAGVELRKPHGQDLRSPWSKVLPQDQWINGDAALSFLTENRDTELNLPVFYEPFKIRFPSPFSTGNNAQYSDGRPKWNWRNYMYGLVVASLDGRTVAGNPGANLLRFREENESNNIQYSRAHPTSHFLWYAWARAEWSKNKWPVIPFFGPYSIGAGTDMDDFRDPLFRPPSMGFGVFFDNATYIPDFLTKKQMDKTDISGEIYTDIKGVYNYYDCVYEELISPNYPETRLPNYYKNRPKKEMKQPRSNYGWSGHSSRKWEGTVRKSLQRILGGQAAVDREDELVRRRVAENYGVFVYDRFRNIDTQDVYANPSAEYFKRVYDERGLFPMYTDIEIGSHSKSEFANAIAINGGSRFNESLLSAFAGSLPSKRMNTVAQFIGSSTDGEREQTVSVVYEAVPGRRRRRGRPRQGQPRVVTDIAEEKTMTKTAVSDIINLDARIMPVEGWLDNLVVPEGEVVTPQDRFRGLISGIVIKSKVKKLIEERYRSDFSEVLNGKPAYSEVLAYKVEKSVDGGPVQSFFFGTSDDLDIIKYVDSQVEYGKRYTYKVYAITAIIGTKYVYLDCMNERALNFFHQNSDSGEDANMYFGVMHTPSVSIAEIAMQEREIAILDKPPLPPNVDIIPYRGIKNKVLLNLNSSTGEMVAHPVELETSDREKFDMVRISQKSPFTGDPAGLQEEPWLSFRNDDPTQVFEIFRTEQMPSGWTSFFGRKIARIESEATSAAFVDTLKPNTKYWYTFRSEDLHGHISNPSHIFQVEMVVENEMMFLKMEPWEFPEISKPTKMKFNNKIMITPTALQTLIPLPENGSLREWEREKKVGDLEEGTESIWAKQFKCRITSKSTGRQIDINFKFNKKYTKILEEVEILDDSGNKC